MYICLTFQILNVGLDGFVLKHQQVSHVFKWLLFLGGGKILQGRDRRGCENRSITFA